VRYNSVVSLLLFEVKCAYRQEWLEGAVLSQVQSKAVGMSDAFICL
jgi:hypothetical protein